MYTIIIHALFTLVNITLSLFPVGPLCIQENTFNFYGNSTLTSSHSAGCLACLFDGKGPLPGTVWLVNGLSTSNPLVSSIVQVNGNGTLVIMRPPGFIDQVILTCQHGGSVFSITLLGELCITAAY